jgi:hypothetical protein
MHVTRIAALAVLGLCLASGPALAAGRNAGINQRQERQQNRIYHGIRSGELTPNEAARLESQEARIAAAEARDRRSGDGLSLRERAQLERRLNQESRQIYRQTHDNQDRGK